MTHFLFNLQQLENQPRLSSQHDEHVARYRLENEISLRMKGKVILDLTKDPDPYGYHSIPLHIRLQNMGWT